MPEYSYLDLVNHCDGFPSASVHPALHLEKVSGLTIFTHETYLLGYILPQTAEILRDPALSGTWWITTPKTISLAGSTREERSQNILKTLTIWREKGLFKVLKGWRGELYPVYAPRSNVLFEIERSACSLFGLVTYGVHMTAYVRGDKFAGGMALWIPTRSRTKPTYPGRLDNTVGGGITSGYTAFETIVKESAEEASLPEDLVREHAKCVGVISYFLLSNEGTGGEIGLMQPEVQICYDLDLTGREDVVPQPCDDEVEEFELMDLEKVRKALRAGRFKTNCAIMVLDFFIRHNIITPENEPDYLEIVARIHRRLEFPTM
ncbi:NUDIX hydrolase domain-like protein [Kalaharituber pfeilii]|nr:NUDIX hydrolase domain-like protein [Kalaharituber pfeilii]